MKRLTVLRVINNLDRGGAQQLLLQFARRFDRERFALEIAAFQSGPLATELQGLRIPLHFCRRRGRFDLSLIRQFQQLIWKSKCDVVHGELFAARFWSRWAAKRERVPFVATLHAIPPRLHRWPYIQAERWFSTDNARFITVNYAQQQFLQRRYNIPEEQTVLLVPAYSPARIKPARKRNEVRSELRLGPAHLAGLCNGRLIEQKGIDILLAGLTPELCQRGFRLFIRGDGPERERLAALTRHKGLTPYVRFLDNHYPLGDLLIAADLFLLPSRWEGFPIAALEAAATGLPLLSSDLPGCHELYYAYPGMTFVPGNRPHRWHAAIAEHLRQPAARLTPLAGFTPDERVSELESIYTHVIRESHAHNA